MNCTEFRGLLGETIRPATCEELRNHASSCPGCSRLLDDSLRLKDALELLKSADAGEQASLSVESRLLAELRVRRAGAAASRFRPAFRTFWPWLAAAAAAVVLAAALVGRMPRRVPEGAMGLRSAPAVAAAPARALPSAVQQVPDRALPPASRTPADRAANAGSSGLRRPRLRMAVGTEFFPTMQLTVDEPGTELQIVRVPVSRKVLDGFGLSLDPRAAGRPIKADLVIGPDGLTRAVRFISERE